MIRRGFVYAVGGVFRDPKRSRPVLVMTSDARNLDPRSATVVVVPLTTRLKGTAFRVRLKAGVGGLPVTSEAACEQVGQVRKSDFLPDTHGRVLPLGGRIDDALLEAVIEAVTHVLRA